MDMRSRRKTRPLPHILDSYHSTFCIHKNVLHCILPLGPCSTYIGLRLAKACGQCKHRLFKISQADFFPSSYNTGIMNPIRVLPRASLLPRQADRLLTGIKGNTHSSFSSSHHSSSTQKHTPDTALQNTCTP